MSNHRSLKLNFYILLLILLMSKTISASSNRSLSPEPLSYSTYGTPYGTRHIPYQINGHSETLFYPNDFCWYTSNMDPSTVEGQTEQAVFNKINSARIKEYFTEKPNHLRKVELLKLQGDQSIKDLKIRLQFLGKLLSNPKQLGNIVMTIGGIALVITTVYYGGKLTHRIIDEYLHKPNLIKESSRKSVYESVTGGFWHKNGNFAKLDDIVLSTDLQSHFVDTAHLIREAHNLGLTYPNLLFYGPPGTGKTFGAKIIAQQSGLDYDIIPGSAFSQLPEGKDIAELDRIFRWIRSSKRGSIVFIDEADSLLSKRSGQNYKADNLVNFFLSNVEKASNEKIMFIFATNYPERLDSAVKSRISQKLFFKLPELKERREQLYLNIQKEIVDKNYSLSPRAKELIGELAKKTEGFSGRTLHDLVIHWRNSLVLKNEQVLSAETMQLISDRFIRQQQEEII